MAAQAVYIAPVDKLLSTLFESEKTAKEYNVKSNAGANPRTSELVPRLTTPDTDTNLMVITANWMMSLLVDDTSDLSAVVLHFYSPDDPSRAILVDENRAVVTAMYTDFMVRSVFFHQLSDDLACGFVDGLGWATRLI